MEYATYLIVRKTPAQAIDHPIPQQAGALDHPACHAVCARQSLCILLGLGAAETAGNAVTTKAGHNQRVGCSVISTRELVRDG